MGTSIEFEADDLRVESMGRYKLQVTADANGGTVLDNFSVGDIVAHFDVAELLDEIGEDAAKEHFDL